MKYVLDQAWAIPMVSPYEYVCWWSGRQDKTCYNCRNVVTNLVLPTSPRTANSPYSNCLFYVGIKCRACIDRCLAGAINENGHDKNKCQQYLRDIGYSRESLKGGYDNEKSVAGCGLCQTKVPCEFQNPTSKLKSKTE